MTKLYAVVDWDDKFIIGIFKSSKSAKKAEQDAIQDGKEEVETKIIPLLN